MHPFLKTLIHRTQMSTTTHVPSPLVTPFVNVVNKVCEPSINIFTLQITIALTCITLCLQTFVIITIYKIGPKYVLRKIKCRTFKSNFS